MHLFYLIFLTTYGHLEAQFIDDAIVNISKKENLDLELDDFIEKNFYKKSSEELRIVFTLKIDSLGEIHSAHIRWNKNLKLEDHYEICHLLELKYRVKFMYNKYKNEFLCERYVTCIYPYFSNRIE